MATSTTTTVLRRSLVGPLPQSTEQTLSLTYFDMIWLHFHPIQRLLFYNFPCSKSQFLETIVPSFETSLSKTLKHYLPLSGTLYYPTRDDSGMPELRYSPGDSVSVTAAEYSGGDPGECFDHLTGNFQRDCDRFYAFFPDLPDPKTEPDFQSIPLLSVQITLFPGVGICLGFNNDHVAGDANSMVRFIKAWGKVAKLGEDDEILTNDTNLLPSYDRSVVKDPKDLRKVIWDGKKEQIYGPRPSILPKDKVRATYILQAADIRKLKNMAQSKKPDLTHLSSYTITTAYVWSCLAKSSSSEEREQEVPDDETEHFAFAVDARSRADPPLPETYFGNCIGAGFAEMTHAELKGEDGFSIAVESISDVIANKVIKKGEFLKDSEEWLPKYYSIPGERLLSVAGSPKFDLYDVDFGWGKPNKYEAVSIDGGRSMSLCKSGEFEGGLEIVLSLPKEKMNAFAKCFYGGLEDM